MDETVEQTAQHYSACMDSVNLIKAGKPKDTTPEEWVLCLKRNKDHLLLALEKTCWTTEDLAPLKAAAASV